MNLRFSGLPEFDYVVALFGRKKIVGVDGIELRIDTVHASDALDEAGWVPRAVIIDDRIRTVKIHAFGQHFSADDYSIVITRLESVCVEICNYRLMGLFTGLACKKNYLRVNFFSYSVCKIRRCFL